MTKTTTQEQRLDYLVEAFKTDSVEYKDLRTPADAESKQRLLRSLMNIRMPRPMAKEIMLVQDEYLKERAEERGTVRLDRIPSISERLGSKRPFADALSLWQGDITCLAVDAIVNAANSQMLGCFQPCHSCIDNCIHTYAGVQLRNACAGIMERQGHEEPTGRAKITPAYNLPCRYVLHTVGPIVRGALTKRHEDLLASCYRACMELAERNGVKSIAFCCISTGVFGFPQRRAAEIAVQTVRDSRAKTHSDIEVIFNVFRDEDYDIYRELLG